MQPKKRLKVMSALHLYNAYSFDVFLTTSPNILALSLASLVARFAAALELMMHSFYFKRTIMCWVGVANHQTWLKVEAR